ncbi:WEB family protein-like [Abeliophyllum distichum]|uniref:WEB family protein-like n=1 Tax=Abeliophyllum distichum TaxID=126358 RepID=A0ABD1NUL9_9LAMI
MHDLENQFWEKSAFIDSLQLELKKANELHIWSEKVASNAISELGQLKADMELQGRKNLDQAAYISLLETELEKLQMELGKSEEEVCHLNTNVENVKSELQIRAEIVETREKENEAQVEIVLLKSELQNERLKLAAAEVSEARSNSETSALYNTLQPLALELEEANKENQELKKAKKLADESKSNNIVELPEENHTQYGELSEEEVCDLNTNVESVKSELEIRAEMVETREKENEAQVEIVLLKSELQNERSKLAAAEVSEARSKSETSALYNTLQPLALELEEAKKENQELKKAKKLADESKSNNIVELPVENHSQYGELSEEEVCHLNTNVESVADEEQKTYEERKDGTDVHETLIKKNASLDENVQEFEGLKKELEVALSKIEEFRIRAEQAISRAEVAENAKTALEEEIKRRRERKERRKAAITALHEELSSRDTSTANGLKLDDAVKNDRSLGKVLNIKF